VVRVVVVLVLERVFVVGGEVAAATTRVLAGRGRDLDQNSVAINQETCPAEMRCQPEGAVEPPDETCLWLPKACQQRMSRVRWRGPVTEEIRPAMA
jgi:hypothetical protein